MEAQAAAGYLPSWRRSLGGGWDPEAGCVPTLEVTVPTGSMLSPAVGLSAEPRDRDFSP